MNSVNLLPDGLRPRAAAGARQNGAYMALGVLGVLLIAVTLYVLTLNGITSNQDELAQLQAEKSESDTTAGALSGFGDFQAIKATRVSSVKTLADGRLDWERLLLEISKVLPEDVWLTGLEGATAAAEATGAPVPGAPVGPSVTLSGCATKQNDVATTLLRLRQLNGAVDVSLDESARPAPVPAVEGAAPTVEVAAEGCGDGYTFAATVVLGGHPDRGSRASSGAVRARRWVMSLTDRDRKVVLVIVPLLLLLVYWFLVLGPKRDESAKIAAKLPAARTAAEGSKATQTRLEGSRAQFSEDYSELIRLGKAVPPDAGHAQPDHPAG